jgi:hypothetical protein
MGNNEKKTIIKSISMNFRYIKLIGVMLCVGIVFTQCADDDDNGNVIEQPSCSDGILNGDEEGIDCGGSCPPCFDGLDFSGVYVQEDIAGRPGVNTVFSGSDVVKNNFNITTVLEREAFQPEFETTLEFYHDIYGEALELEIDYETNILGWDATTFTTVMSQFDALQVAPEGPTTYFDGTNILTGRNLSDDVIDISLTLMFGGTNGTRFDGTNGTPQLTSDGVGPGDRNFTLPFPYLESPISE